MNRTRLFRKSFTWVDHLFPLFLLRRTRHSLVRELRNNQKEPPFSRKPQTRLPVNKSSRLLYHKIRPNCCDRTWTLYKEKYNRDTGETPCIYSRVDHPFSILTITGINYTIWDGYSLARPLHSPYIQYPVIGCKRRNETGHRIGRSFGICFQSLTTGLLTNRITKILQIYTYGNPPNT